MAITLEDLDGGVGLLIRITGSLTGREYIEVMTKHFSRPAEELSRFCYAITDMSGITKIDFPASDMREFFHMSQPISSFCPKLVSAIIATRDVLFGLSRMYETISDELSWEQKVFRTEEEAILWVDERVRARFGIQGLTYRPM